VNVTAPVWLRPIPKSRLPAETVTGATLAALRFVRYSPDIKRLLVRSARLVFVASAFWALLPSVAKNLGHGSLGYGLLLGCFGLVCQGSIALGSVLWGIAADHASADRALIYSSGGIALCLALQLIVRLPEATGSLDVWNHWKLLTFEEPGLDEGPVLVTVEYKIDATKEFEFLEAIHNYQRIRRRDGAIHWGIYYDANLTWRVPRELSCGLLGRASTAT